MAKPNGPNIEAERVRKGWSRTELAKKVDRSYQWVFNVEREHRTTSPEQLYRLARVLELPIGDVMRSDWQEKAG
jgi:ribosome-binding protein aMBF1 (putative translation factor)